MKHLKVLRLLALVTAITVAVPNVMVPVQASEKKETPKEYEERTKYELREGYRYVLEDDKYIILDEDGEPVIEEDKEEPKGKASGSNETKSSDEEEGTPADDSADSLTGAPGEEASDVQPGESEGNPSDIQSAGPEGSEENPSDIGLAQPGGSEENPSDIRPAQPEGPEGNLPGAQPGAPTEGVNVGQPEGAEENGGQSESEKQDGNLNEEGSQAPSAVPGGEAGDAGSGDSNGPEQPGEPGNPGDKDDIGDNDGRIRYELKKYVPANGSPQNGADVSVQPSPDTAQDREGEGIQLLPPIQPEVDADFLISDPFSIIGERIQYNTAVPIEGLPSFITQEMIVGALKAQDETGYPASVTIAQIIQESGYGSYGPGGENGQGLSFLAYQYCNLFGIKGTGTAGSANMNTFEMTPAGETYSTVAGFRAYHTYTECIEDRTQLLKEVYSDLTENVTDANTFAMQIGKRWATSLYYGKSLIRVMEQYDLYRLDEMTLFDFNEMIGRFANPCPGAVVTSTFGYRSFDNSVHKGLDLGTGAENIPTYAAEAGVVTFSGNAGTAGNMVVIDHGNGLVTKYMHHAELYVKEGQKVAKGQQIGLSGTTGYSTGNHLHFQVEENGAAVDPMPYLQDRGSSKRAVKLGVKTISRDGKSVSTREPAGQVKKIANVNPIAEGTGKRRSGLKEGL